MKASREKIAPTTGAFYRRNLASCQSVFFEPTFRQFAKFVFVGCLNVIISTVVFYLCYRQWQLAHLIFELTGQAGESAAALLERQGIQSLDAAVATIAGYTAGMANSFMLNRTWTFGARSDVLGQMRRFFLLNIAGLGVSTLIMFTFVDLLNGPYVVVWVITVGLVMVLNFVGNKYWTFARRRADEVNESP